MKCRLFERQERQLIKAWDLLKGRLGFLSNSSLSLAHSEIHNFIYIFSRGIFPCQKNTQYCFYSGPLKGSTYCGLVQGKGATVCLINQLPLVYFSEFAVILNLFY